MQLLFESIWNYETQVVAPPSPGCIRSTADNTTIWLHRLDQAGYDRSIELDRVPDPPFRILARDTDGQSAFWEVQAIARVDDHYALMVEFIDGGGSPLPKNIDVLVQVLTGGEEEAGPTDGWYITIDQIRLLFPGISDEEAARLQELVTMAINAVTCEEIPTDPVPDAVQFAAMLWVGQMYGAAPGGGALMSSERIGDYSYTLTGGATLEDAMSQVPVNVATYLGPWLCVGVTEANAFQLTTWPPPSWTRDGWVGSTYGWLPPSERAD